MIENSPSQVGPEHDEIPSADEMSQLLIRDFSGNVVELNRLSARELLHIYGWEVTPQNTRRVLKARIKAKAWMLAQDQAFNKTPAIFVDQKDFRKKLDEENDS
ncbi:MAG: hypothetical protein ACOZAN_04280 [Patescibacteria group bacterium]